MKKMKSPMTHDTNRGKGLNFKSRDLYWRIRIERRQPMPQKIEITAGNVRVEAELNDSPTAKAIADALPVEAPAQRWGGEIYFSVPVTAELEDGSRDVLEAGELGYWPPGKACCIFFGPTPASAGAEIRAASAVNIIGKIKGDCSGLWDVPEGTAVVIKTT
jgi:hypothetical protein